MYKILFYKDGKGNEELFSFLKDLSNRNDKRSKKLFKSFTSSINALSLFGLNLGMPKCRRINSDIWELRIKRYRVFFFKNKEEIVLLHFYYKKTKKTPEREIDKAIKEMKEVIENES